MIDPTEIRLMRITVEALKREKLPFSKDEKWCKRTERYISYRVRGVWVLCMGNGTVAVQSEMSRAHHPRIEEAFKSAGLRFSQDRSTYQWTVCFGD